MALQNTPPLTTERLRLRRFTEQDLPALYAIHRDPEVNTFLPWFPLTSMEEARAFYQQRYQEAYRAPVGYRYAICRREDDVPIGYIHVETTDGHDFGYGLARAFWGNGFVSEAGRAVLSQVKRDGLPFVTATHDVNNPKSGAVMRRLGMRYQYSYEEQWQPKDFRVTFRMYQLNLDPTWNQVYMGYWNGATVRCVEEGVM